MYHFRNNKDKLIETNYFQSDAAMRGECYLSWNDGVARLLIPKGIEQSLMSEMSTTSSAEIEYIEGGMHLYFIDDDPNYPYLLQLAQEQTDRMDASVGSTAIAIYTQDGFKCQFSAEVLGG